MDRGQGTPDAVVHLTGGPYRVAYRRQLIEVLVLILEFILRKPPDDFKPGNEKITLASVLRINCEGKEEKQGDQLEATLFS